MPAVHEAHAARPRGHRRLVRLGLHAVRAGARPVRERRSASRRTSPRTSSARRSTRRAAGSTRCSPSAMLLFGRASYEHVVCLGLLLDDAGREDVEVQGQHRRALGRDRRASAPTRSAGTSSRPSSRGTATASRWRRSASRCACSCASCGTCTRSSIAMSADGPDGGETDLDRWIKSRLARDGGRGDRRAWTPTTRRSPGARSRDFVDDLSNWYVRRSRRRFWEGDPSAFATLRECAADGRAAARAVHAVRRRRDLGEPRRRRASRCT